MSNNKDNIFGTDPVELRRADAPFTSVAASETVNSKVWEERVYKTISRYGPDGCISDQIRAAWPGTPYSTITARYKSLGRKGLITSGPDVRKGKAGVIQQVRRAKDPEPDADWVVRLQVKLNGKPAILDVQVRTNNEKEAVILAKRKAVEIKVISANKMPDWIQT